MIRSDRVSRPCRSGKCRAYCFWHLQLPLYMLTLHQRMRVPSQLQILAYSASELQLSMDRVTSPVRSELSLLYLWRRLRRLKMTFVDMRCNVSSFRQTKSGFEE